MASGPSYTRRPTTCATPASCATVWRGTGMRRSRRSGSSNYGSSGVQQERTAFSRPCALEV
eukprot:scaffold73914_cov67-Phaeocystis_antarctica.AAC.2